MYIVTGMHRSGTSFLSQALNALGADFGPSELLFPSDFWNQKGYFENQEVVDLNNRLILGDKAHIEYWLAAPEHGLARFRNSLRSRKWKYLFPPNPEKVATRAAGHATGLEALHATYRGLYVKDPRFCLTLPAWTGSGSAEGFVFSFRHPVSVAKSIRRREKLPLFLGYRQWLDHVRHFIAQAPQDVPIFFVDFDAFFDAARQPVAFARLASYMGQPAEAAAAAQLQQTLDVRLRNQTSEDIRPPARVAAAYEGLAALYAASPDGAPIRLDAHPDAVSLILAGQ